MSFIDELVENGWFLEGFYYRHKCPSIPVISPSLEKDGEYIMCGKKVSTYKDVANTVVKFLDEVAKPFREV